jgi:carboxypeptidase PM20D1
MASAAPAPNVLPQKAEAIVNVRIHSAQTIHSVLAHFGKAIGDDRVKLSVEKGNNSSKVSETDCESYRLLEQTIRSLRPEAVVVPSPLVTGTDAVNYDAVSDHVYRFGPFFGEMAYKHTIHAANERMPVDSLHEGATFYAALIRNLCEAGRRAFE